MNWDISFAFMKPGAVVVPAQIQFDCLMLKLKHQKHQQQLKHLHDKVQRRVKWLKSRREYVCFYNPEIKES